MANRVNADKVKEIIDTSISDPDINAFITAANTVVNEILGTGTSAVLTEIEKWLAAHLIATTRSRQVKSESVGDADITYDGQTGKGLDASMYGQQVKLLDTTGKLAARVGKLQASIYSITSFEV